MEEAQLELIEKHLAPFRENRVGAVASPDVQKWIDFTDALATGYRSLQGELASSEEQVVTALAQLADAQAAQTPSKSSKSASAS